MDPSEKFIETHVCKFAATLGWKYKKQNGTGERGKFDRYFTRYPAQIVFVEFKKSGIEPSDLQKFEQRQLLEMGFPAVFIDSIENGEEYFKGLDEDEVKDGW